MGVPIGYQPNANTAAAIPTQTEKARKEGLEMPGQGMVRLSEDQIKVIDYFKSGFTTANSNTINQTLHQISTHLGAISHEQQSAFHAELTELKSVYTHLNTHLTAMQSHLVNIKDNLLAANSTLFNYQNTDESKEAATKVRDDH